MRQLTELDSDKFGLFLIEQVKKRHYIVWWDFYRENEGGVLEPDGDFIEWMLSEADDEVVLKGLEFSDVPKDGKFKTYDEAYNFLVKKFGNLE